MRRTSLIVAIAVLIAIAMLIGSILTIARYQPRISTRDLLVALVPSGAPKDTATVFIAVLALAISAYSVAQKTAESRISVRKQLSESLAQLSEVNLAFANRGEESKHQLRDTAGILNDQRRYLVRQAAFLAGQIANQVSVPEYLMIAWAFNAIDDVDEANRFFGLAICVTSDRFSHGIALRSHGRFLLWEGSEALATTRFNEALDAFGVTDDRARNYRGETYERWAQVEFDWERSDHAFELIELAEREYSEIENPLMKRRAMDRLAVLRKQRPTAFPLGIYIAAAVPSNPSPAAPAIPGSSEPQVY